MQKGFNYLSAPLEPRMCWTARGFGSFGNHASRLNATAQTSRGAPLQKETLDRTTTLRVVQSRSSTDATFCQAFCSRALCCTHLSNEDNAMNDTSATHAPKRKNTFQSQQDNNRKTGTNDLDPEEDTSAVSTSATPRTTYRRARTRTVKLRWHGLRTRLLLTVHSISEVRGTSIL